ncbi:MAG: NADH-quinone oxidoreductase subunit H [bacterium]|nr:NADH-quinone oxidoreductase subunit H [bacterium]
MWSDWETFSAFCSGICPALFPAIMVLAAPLVGALLMGIDRKITARIQGRIGPPILQPVYDVLKLFAKEPLFLNRLYIFYAWLYLAFMILVVVLLAMGQDILMVLFVHAFATIALILGAMSVRSPYSRIGASRKIMQMVAYEPILILFVVGIYLSTPHPHSFLASAVMKLNQPLLFTLPLLLPAYFAAVVIKMEKSPFDVSSGHHAHQELVRGVTIEYSGPFLALIEIAHFYEVFILFFIMAMFWSTNLWIGAGIALAGFFAQILVDNASPRLTTFWMIRFMWAGPMLLALCNIVWLYGMGRG